MGSKQKNNHKDRSFRAGAHLFSTLTLLLAVILISPFILQFIINTPLVKNRLSSAIKTYSGLELHQDKIKFCFFPKPGICMEQIDLKIAPKAAFSIEQAILYLDFGKLLKRKFIPTQIHIHHPVLYTPLLAPRQDNNSGPAKKESSQYTLSIPPTTFSAKAADTFAPALAIQYVVQQIATVFPESRKEIRIRITQGTSIFCAEFNAECIIPADRKTFNLNLELKDIDVSGHLLTQFDQLTGGRIPHVTAGILHLDLRASASGQMKGNMTLTRPQIAILGMHQNITIPHPLTATISISQTSASALIGPWHFDALEGEIKVEMAYDHQSKDTRLAFSGKEINITQARSTGLSLLGGHPIVDSLFDILRAGTAQDIIVEFKSNLPAELFSPENLIIQGNVVGARVKIPTVPLILQDVDGHATMKGGVLHIRHACGRLHGAQIKGGTLDIDIINHPNTPFTGSFNIEANLASLPQTLSSLFPDTPLSAELVRISEISGKTLGVLTLEMPAGMHATLGIHVDADIHQASGRYEPVPFPMTIKSGKFHYTNDKIQLSHVSGQLGERPLKIDHWEVGLISPFLMTGRGIHGRIDTEQLLIWARAHPAIMKHLSPLEEIKGLADIEVLHLLGPMFSPVKWQFNLNSSAQNIAIGFTAGQRCIQHIAGVMNITQNSFTANDISGVIQDLSWLENDRNANLISSIRVPLKLSQAIFTQKQSGCTLKGRLETPGGPVVTLELNGSSPKHLTLSGITVEDQNQPIGQITVNDLTAPHQFDLDGQFNTLSLAKMLRPDSIIQHQIHAVTGGTPLVVSVLPTQGPPNISVNAEFIDIDTLLALRNPAASLLSIKTADDTKLTKTPSIPTQRPLIGQKKLVLTSQALTVKQKAFKNVAATVTLNKNDTNISIQGADFCDMNLSGNLLLSETPKGTMVSNNIRFRSHPKKTSTDRLFSCLLGSQSIIQGQCTVQGNILGKSEIPSIHNNQNGTLSFRAQNGRIYKATVLSRVLSLLNILGETDIYQKGFGYKSMTVKTEIKNSVMHIQRAYIDAVDMAIVASGWVDPNNDRLDLTFLVAPFKTIDTVIQHIPLINTMLKNRLASFPVQALGKLSDPTVIPLHPSAVRKGLITLFTDLINAPTRIFTGDSPP